MVDQRHKDWDENRQRISYGKDSYKERQQEIMRKLARSQKAVEDFQKE